MSEISINTTQNVNINFQAANVGHRFLAYLIDLVMKICYAIVVNWLIIRPMNLEAFTLDSWSIMSIYIILFLPVTFYSLVMETFMEGQTIGKKILNIKVVKIDGYQANFLDYLTRWVFRIIDVVMSWCLVGTVSILSSKIHQRLGDIAAGTAVISLKNDINISHTILEEIRDDYEPSYPQVVRFSDNDMRIIKETFLAATRNDDRETLAKLIRKIEEVSGIKAEGNAFKFVSTIIKDYNYYTGE
jgi:uncharacterized RDD family membrane protein YckC